MDLAGKRRTRKESPQEVRRHLSSSAQPLYASLSQVLRSQIIDGHWQAGAQLPTIAELSERYGVARVTVRQALAELSAQGLIQSLQGKGTYVSSRIQKPKLIELDSSWQSFLQQIEGNVPELLYVEEEAELPALREGEGVPARSYRFMQRVHRSKGVAYSATDIYLDNDCYALAPHEFDSKIVIPVLEKVAGGSLRKLMQSFRIVTADMVTADKLGLPLHAPIGEVRRAISNQAGTVVYLGIAKNRGDLVVLNTTIELPHRAGR